MRTEHAMKSREVNLWPRAQGRKLFHEFHGRHFDGSGALLPPLSDIFDWQNGINEVGCGLTHPSSAAAGAESPAFAAECHKVLEFAGLALDSEEAIGQDPASQKLFELFDHEIWQWVAGVPLNLFPKRQPVLLHDFVKNRLFGLVAFIGVLGSLGNFGHATLQNSAVG